MTKPAVVVVSLKDWRNLWDRYRTLISGTLELYISNDLHRETIMRDFERLRGECEDGGSYWEFQRSRLDDIHKRRSSTPSQPAQTPEPEA